MNGDVTFRGPKPPVGMLSDGASVPIWAHKALSALGILDTVNKDIMFGVDTLRSSEYHDWSHDKANAKRWGRRRILRRRIADKDYRHNLRTQLRYHGIPAWKRAIGTNIFYLGVRFGGWRAWGKQNRYEGDK